MKSVEKFSEPMEKLNAGKVRSMNLITTALFELLETKRFADISVTDICERAGVSRKTFYRNFDSKPSVVGRLVDQVFYEFYSKNDFKKTGARKVYLYWYEYMLCTREFSLIFFDPELYDFMIKKIREFVELEVNESLHNAVSFDPMLESYYLDFAASGIAAIMRGWMKDDCRTPAKTMANLTARLLSGMLL